MPCLESKGVEWNKESNLENIWEKVKRAMVECTSMVFGLVRVGRKKPKCVVE